MPLTESQRRTIERRLHEERARALESIRRYSTEEGAESERDRTGEISAVRFHMADEGTDTFDRELNASMATRDTENLHEIDDALRRLIETPDLFGKDEVSGEDIPFERLEIIPWARRSAQAMRRRNDTGESRGEAGEARS
ncbi:MAG TPA: hypothetical protein VHM30_10115 [Gemmatimonadaceae bacterium]|nr:hypothetical protein [Gemmatimonadaceae bacterium]